MTREPMTKEGFDRLNKELKELVSKERPEIIKAIASARELGDLSENAEYHAAREKQSFVEGRIQYLENKIATAEVIDVSKLNEEKVVFGAIVELEEEETERSVKYQIVGENEADIKKGKISFKSPIARALIGKETGDDVEVAAPGGTKEYTIINVTFK